MAPSAHSDITLLVRAQDVPHDSALVADLTASVAEAGWSHRAVVSMVDAEEELGHGGLWTYKPWIFALAKSADRARRRVPGGQRWLVFLEPATAVDAVALGEVLAGYDAREKVYLGRSLRDDGASIIHHYSQEPPYPHAHAGFALSWGLVQKLAQDLEANPLGSGQQIEPVWELADWARKLGVGLTDRSDAFCLERRPGCATWVRPRPRTSGGLKPEEVVVAVKTVGSLHASRIPHVQESWAGRSSAEVLYLSNEGFEGAKGATVVDLSPEFGDMVDPAKESTKQGSGHCAKMRAILQWLWRHRPGKKWYVVTDDDTLLNVPRLLGVLGSHNGSAPVYLGERYGWAHTEGRGGTNYVTTGGGMALSGPALSKLLECDYCQCRTPNSPDDMSLGSWFRALEVPIVHEEGFHQAEPYHYHRDVLRHADPPVSFHRFATSMLPGSASAEQKDAARRTNWARWAQEYFGQTQGGGGDEL